MQMQRRLQVFHLALNVSLRTVQKITKQSKSVGSTLAKDKSGLPPSVNTRRIRNIIKNGITWNDIRSRILQQKVRIFLTKVFKKLLLTFSIHHSSILYDVLHFAKDAKVKKLTRCKKTFQIFNVRPVEERLWKDEKLFSIEKARSHHNDL